MATSSMRGTRARGAPETVNKWTLADAHAKKEGPRRTMFFVEAKKRAGPPAGRVKAGGEKLGPVVEWAASSSYQGEWSGDKRSGFGTMTYPSGDKYEGDWADGKRHGRGTLWVKRDGTLVKRYAGDWVAGKWDGAGSLFYENGDRYEGQFVAGRRHGQGTHVFANGDVYEGEWVDNQRTGVGVLTLKNGDVYEGHWKADKKHGPGRFFFQRTRKLYEGEWVDDVAKCGVFSEIAPDEENDLSPAAPKSTAGFGPTATAAAAVGAREDDFDLPSLGLANPDAVIREAVAVARDEGRRRLAAAAAASTRGGFGATLVDGEGGASSERVGTGSGGGGGGGGAGGGGSGGDGEGSGEEGVDGDGSGGAGYGPGGIEDLTEEELVQLEDAFAAGDPDDEGFIPASRLPIVFEALGLRPSPEELVQVRERMGIPNRPDAAVGFEVFADCMARLRE